MRINFLRLKCLVTVIIIGVFASNAGAWKLFKDDDDDKQAAAQRAIIALNYCHASLHKIIDYNDRIVLDEQYSEIINNINLRKIDDEEVIDLLEGLMHTLNKFQINEEDRKILNRKYEKKMERAFYEAFSNPGSLMAADPISAGVNALVSIGSSYASYRQKQEEYREELDDSVWELKKDEMTRLTSLRAEFLRVYWQIMRDREIPDKKRLTEKQLTNYIEILKDKDLKRQFRKLDRIKSNFSAYPPFWYYYGKVAQDIGDKKTAIMAYRKFESIHRGFFREDTFYTSVLMNKITLLDSKRNKKEIIKDLGKIYEYSPNDSRKRLFSAIKYYQLGKYDKSKDLLQANIDDNKIVRLSTQMLGQVYVATRDAKSLEAIVEKMLAGDTHENYEILYLLGEMPEKKIIEKMKDQILGIEVKIDKDVVWDDLTISMPIKWAFEDPERLKIRLNYSGKEFSSEGFDLEKDGKRIEFSFGDKFDFDDFEKSNFNLKLEFKIDHPYHKISLVGNLKKVTVVEEHGLIGKSYNKMKSWVVDDDKIKNVKTVEHIVFVTEYIATKNHKYVVKENGDIDIL